jgi:hypothetical protein
LPERGRSNSGSVFKLGNRGVFDSHLIKKEKQPNSSSLQGPGILISGLMRIGKFGNEIFCAT